MIIEEPKVEYWEQKGPIDHVCKCAQVCYQSKPKEGEAAKKFYNALISSGHISMLRHESCYFIVTDWREYPNFSLAFNNNPYIEIHWMYVATNANFLLDNPRAAKFLEPFRVTPEEFKKECPELMRYTFCLTTQISTSRELNRANGDFGISEMSTRYIRFGGKIEPSIVRPWWISKEDSESWNSEEHNSDLCESNVSAYEYLCSCYNAFRDYDGLLQRGLKPEDARGLLPLDTMTKVVYTASIKVWRHIIDLRYYGTTGKPHENAKTIIGMVKSELENLGYKFSK